MEINQYNFFKELCKIPALKKIIVYGSRARKNNDEKADIDLAISCSDDKSWLQILDIVENADTLLKIDCVCLERLSEDSKLKANIMSEGVILFNRAS
jgi:predicted nucleotidyltransferase